MRSSCGPAPFHPVHAPPTRLTRDFNPLAPHSGERVASTASRVRGQKYWPRPCALHQRGEGGRTPSPCPLPRSRGGEGKNPPLPRSRGATDPLAPPSGERVASAASRVRGQKYWPRPCALHQRGEGGRNPLTLPSPPLPRERGMRPASPPLPRGRGSKRGSVSTCEPGEGCPGRRFPPHPPPLLRHPPPRGRLRHPHRPGARRPR